MENAAITIKDLVALAEEMHDFVKELKTIAENQKTAIENKHSAIQSNYTITDRTNQRNST